MKIKMLNTRYGSEDGFIVRRFEAGKEYNVADNLGVHFTKTYAAFNCEDEEVAVTPASEIVLDILGNLNGFDYRQLTNPATLQAQGVEL